MIFMVNVKEVFGSLAIILTFIAYVPYIRDIIRRKTKPHIYSWFLWGLVGFIVFVLQIKSGAGIGSFVTLAAVLMCLLVLFLSLFLKSERDISKSDKIFIGLAILSLIMWLVMKQPIISVILATITDLLGFVPTIRKSWKKPETETVAFYIITTFRFALAVLSLKSYSIVTALYPVSWLLVNSIFAGMIIIRKKQILKYI